MEIILFIIILTLTLPIYFYYLYKKEYNYCYMAFKLSDDRYKGAVHSMIRYNFKDSHIIQTKKEVVARIESLGKRNECKKTFDKIKNKYGDKICCSCFEFNDEKIELQSK